MDSQVTVILKPKLRVADVAVMFDVTPATIYRWVEQGKLIEGVSRTPGGGLRFDPGKLPEAARLVEVAAIE